MQQAGEGGGLITNEPAASSAIAAAARRFTSKQMGDACEMLIAAELTLAGIPALKVPDNWPHYDVIAQPNTGPAQRISVKSRTFKSGPAYVAYKAGDQFDWLAIVLLSAVRDIYMVPRSVADQHARRDSRPVRRPSFATSASTRWGGCLAPTAAISPSRLPSANFPARSARKALDWRRRRSRSAGRRPGPPGSSQ